MAETIVTIPAADLDRLVYVAIAEARNDAQTERLAGLADRILQRRPNVTPVGSRSGAAPHRPAGRDRDEHRGERRARAARCLRANPAPPGVTAAQLTASVSLRPSVCGYQRAR
jgi:hypothetical protein